VKLPAYLLTYLPANYLLSVPCTGACLQSNCMTRVTRQSSSLLQNDDVTKALYNAW